MNRNLKSIAVIACSTLLLTACLKDNFDFDKLASGEWNPEFAIPVISANLSLEDLLVKATQDQQDFVDVGPDGMITLVYRGELTSIKAEDLFVIGDQNFSQTVQPGQSIPNIPVNDTVQFQDSQVINFDAGTGNKLDSLVVNTGTLNLNFNSTFKHSISATLTLPNATRNGVPVTVPVELNYSGTSPVVSSISVNLDGCKFDMTQGGTSFNQFDLDYALTLHGSGAGVDAADALQLSGTITNITFRKIFGELSVGSFTTDLDTVDITVFNAIVDAGGDFSLVGPSIKMILSNSFGLPLSVGFPVLEGANPNIGTYFNLVANPDIPSPFVLPAPSYVQAGQYATDSFTISTSVEQFVNAKPRYFKYQINGNSATAPGEKSFILDTSMLKVRTEVLMPLHGAFKGFVVQDTLKSEFTNFEELESMTLRMRIRNGFPIDVYTQIYLTDANYNIIDSLIPTSSALMAAAPVNLNGEVVTYNETTTDVTCDRARIENFIHSYHMIIRGRCATYDNGTKPVKIYSDYYLDVRAGIVAKVSIDL